jgi:hypothetical protein
VWRCGCATPLLLLLLLLLVCLEARDGFLRG